MIEELTREEIFRKEISHKVISDLFNTLSCEYFLMGSQRFGYEKSTSDLDFSVCEDNNTRFLIAALSALGFYRVVETKYSSIHYRSALSDIDIIILKRKLYEQKKDQHERLEKLLKDEENKELLEFLKILKREQPIDGKSLYRMLVTVFLNEKPI